jgi:hypothetical protein
MVVLQGDYKIAPLLVDMMMTNSGDRNILLNIVDMNTYVLRDGNRSLISMTPDGMPGDWNYIEIQRSTSV